MNPKSLTFAPMIRHSGDMEIVYNGRRIVIPYSISNIVGSIHIDLVDKHGRSHPFFYRSSTSEWISVINTRPQWPDTFYEVLFQAFEAERGVACILAGLSRRLRLLRGNLLVSCLVF